MTRPIILFKESISTGNSEPFLVKSPNKRNIFWIKAEPLEKPVLTAIEAGKIGFHLDERELSTRLRYYGWNDYDSKNVITFGPEDDGSNVLIDGTHNNHDIEHVRKYLSQGFKWSTTKGPLCGEPFYGIKFSLIDYLLQEEISFRGIAEIQSTFNKACCGALLSAKPILLETIYKIQVITPVQYVKSIYKIFLKGRRKLLTAKTTGDTSITVILGEVPITESIGISKEITSKSSGKATVFKKFDHYEKVPGDPLLVEGGLARQYVEKIRERKQMSKFISI